MTPVFFGISSSNFRFRSFDEPEELEFVRGTNFGAELVVNTFVFGTGRCMVDTLFTPLFEVTIRET